MLEALIGIVSIVVSQVEPEPIAASLVMAEVLPLRTRSTMTVTEGLEEEHVSALISVTMHCNVADDPSRTMLPVRVADGAGTVETIAHKYHTMIQRPTLNSETGTV